MMVWPTTCSLNEKGGMDNDEFEENILHNIVCLYPDACDVQGNRVIIKVDSGTGHLNMNLIARLCNLGFYLYPSVPNLTAVTQETDQNYGTFKSIFRQNLVSITNDCIAHNKPVSFPPFIVGLFVFGGTDPETNCNDYKNAFEIAFSKTNNLCSWRKVGAAPLMRACLLSPLVRRELNDANKDNDTGKNCMQFKRQMIHLLICS